MAGKIILVHGASSSGKSTLCRALHAALDEPFWHFSIDHLRDAGVLPSERTRSGEFPWALQRTAFFDGFHACLPVLAEAGNNLIVEHIVETEEWRERLVRTLAPFDTFFVSVRCPLPELERRERERGDRPPGDARRDFETLPKWGIFDLEIDSTLTVEQNVAALLQAWKAREEK